MTDCENVVQEQVRGLGDWVLVPRVPTDAMLRAAQSAWLNDPQRRTTAMWSAMLYAAPQQPAGVEEISEDDIANIAWQAGFYLEKEDAEGEPTEDWQWPNSEGENMFPVLVEFSRKIAALAQRPAEGEDIMVNTPYDVFILPLQPSGLSSGPRFVVHVPGPEQPAPQAQSSTEAWRDLAIAGVAIVEEIREIVGLKGKPGDVVEAVRELVALRDGEAKQPVAVI